MYLHLFNKSVTDITFDICTYMYVSVTQQTNNVNLYHFLDLLMNTFFPAFLEISARFFNSSDIEKKLLIF